MKVKTPSRPRRRAQRKVWRSPQAALRSYRQDPTVRGLDYVVVAYCLPVAELAALDVVCESVQMARSHFLRQATKHFTAWIEGPRNGQHPAMRITTE